MVKNALIIFLALFLSVILFELFLRYSPFSYGLSPVVYDKDIGMWHKKHFSSNAIRECYNTKYFFDKDGLVKLNYHYDKKKKDILIFGDSFTEAIMVENKNIIHNALWKEYDGKYNFLNYGLSGTSPTQQFVILAKKAKLDNVKTVLQIINIDSDIYDVDPANLKALARPKVTMKFLSLKEYVIIAPRTQSLKDKIMDIVGNYQLYIPIKKSIYHLKEMMDGLQSKDENEKVQIRDKKSIDLSANWLQIEGAIYQTKKLLDSNNVDYKVIINSEKQENIDKLSRILDKHSVPFLNLNTLVKENVITLPHFSCDRHWSDEAHQNIAKYIYKNKFINHKKRENHQKINTWILEEIEQNNYRVTEENIDSYDKKLLDLAKGYVLPEIKTSPLSSNFR